MRRSYASLFRFQGGWSSLQRHSHAQRNTHRGLSMQTTRLGNLKARSTSRMCAKNLQAATNRGRWARKAVSFPSICSSRSQDNLFAFAYSTYLVPSKRDAEHLLSLRKSETLRGTFKRPVKITFGELELWAHAL